MTPRALSKIVFAESVDDKHFDFALHCMCISPRNLSNSLLSGLYQRIYFTSTSEAGSKQTKSFPVIKFVSVASEIALDSLECWIRLWAANRNMSSTRLEAIKKRWRLDFLFYRRYLLSEFLKNCTPCVLLTKQEATLFEKV